MAVARLVMQYWKDLYDVILANSQIEELLSGLYVDDGRTMHRKLKFGERFCQKEKCFKVHENLVKIDLENDISLDELTRTEVLKAMNSVSPDLEFTMELCEDFKDNRLPTLSFSLWKGAEGLCHSYYEKEMKNQTLVVERSSMPRHNLMGIMSNEMRRRR